MKIAILRERRAHETRVAATPETVKRFAGYGLSVAVEKGAGRAAAFRDDDYAAAGAKIANRCKACHALDKPIAKIGPHLVGIVGRPVASVADFTKYSDAMKASGAAGAVWDAATLSQYLADPKGFIPGNSMAFPGIKKPEDIANLIAYFESLPKP